MEFNTPKVQRVNRFFERVLKLTTGQYWGKPFELAPWQKFANAQIFGPCDSDGLRLVREVYLTIAKKNGKTEWMAGLGLAILLLDEEYAAEVYGLASSREQAGICFRTAQRMVAQSRILQERLQVYTGSKTIALRRGGGFSFWKVLSADASTGDGPNPHAVLYDELHRAKDAELYDTMKAGADTRAQPLIIGATTAGDEDSGLAKRQHEYAELVQNGDIQDRSFLPLLFQHTDPKDWKNQGQPGVANSTEEIESGGKLWLAPPTGWYAANPSLEGNPGGFIKLEKVEQSAKKAETNPLELQNFQRFRLNMWMSTVARWIPDEEWRACRVQLPEDLDGCRTWVGVDLSSTRDITAVAWLIDCRGQLLLDVRFYMPDHNLQERSKADQLPYASWAAKGLLTLTPGRMVNYDRVFEDIRSMPLDIDSIVIDRWNAGNIAQDLDAEGYDVRMISQGYGDLGPACKEFERLLGEQEIGHNGNQIMDWMVACTETQQDNQGNIRPKRPNRKRSRKRIDGVAAAINAVVAYQRGGEDEDVGITVLSA